MMQPIKWFMFVLIAGCGAQALGQETLQLPSTARWLGASPTQVWALLDNGEVYSLQPQLRRAAQAWSPQSPIQYAHGRLHGVSRGGELVTLEDNQLYQSQGAKLSLNAGVLGLPAGVIAVGKTGDLLRLEQSGRGWQITARAAVKALPDTTPVLADLEGDGDPEVVALLGPSNRYPHGVLGDALEATGIAAFERHSLEVLWRLDLSAPFVFEDIALRLIRQSGREMLVTVRSGPQGGAALALVDLSNQKLRLNLGPDFGIPNRWLNPLVGSGELYAIHTPHIGGVLYRYQIQGIALQAARLQEGLSSHKIGSRNVGPAAVVKPGHLIVPTQDHRALLHMDCNRSCQTLERLELAGEYSSNLMLFKNQVLMGDSSGRVYFWSLGSR